MKCIKNPQKTCQYFDAKADVEEIVCSTCKNNKEQTT